MIDEVRLKRTIQHEVGHYIAFRALDIIPKRIEIYIIPDAIVEEDHKEDGIIGATIIPTDNFFFEEMKDISDFSFAQCVSLAAGTFSEYLNFSSKEINKESACKSFMNDSMCEKDKMFFWEHLPYFIASNFDEYKETLGTDEAQKMATITIFNKVCEIIINNAEIIEKLTDYVFQKVKTEYTEILYSEFNEIDYIVDKFGKLEPGIFVTTSETIK